MAFPQHNPLKKKKKKNVEQFPIRAGVKVYTVFIIMGVEGVLQQHREKDAE